MAELGFQSLTPDDATIDSSNCDGRAGREKFLRGMTEEESGESGIVFYEPWFNPDTNTISFRHGYVQRPIILTSATAERDSFE